MLLKEDIYQDIDHLTEAIFVANIWPTFVNYTVTLRWGTSLPMQYAFNSTEEGLVQLFQQFHRDLLALEFYSEKAQDSSGKRVQMTLTRL